MHSLAADSSFSQKNVICLPDVCCVPMWQSLNGFTCKKAKALPTSFAKVPTLHRISVGRNLESRWRYEGGGVVTAGTFLGHICPAVGCPGWNSWRPGPGWCRRSISERRNWLLPFGYTTVQGCWMLPGIQALTVRGCFVVAPVDMLAVEVTNIYTGLYWERWDGRRCESRAWMFVDVNGLIYCHVYTQPHRLWFLWRLIDQWTFQFRRLMNKRGKAGLLLRTDRALSAYTVPWHTISRSGPSTNRFRDSNGSDTQMRYWGKSRLAQISYYKGH